MQLRYVFLAFVIPSGLVTITNLLIPLIFGTSTYNSIGPVLSLITIAMVAHAIIRHRLLDIRVVIGRGVVYLGTFLVSLGVFALLLVTSNVILPDKHGLSFRDIVFALVAGLVFHPVKTAVQRVLNRYLYRETYDYARTLRDASRALGGTIDLPVLLGHVTITVVRSLKPETVRIYLLEEGESDFRIGSSDPEGNHPTAIRSDSLLVELANQTHEPIFRDEILTQAGHQVRDVCDELQRLNAEVVVPLVEQDQVIGLLCLGPKRSGDPYFSDDADLLTTLANQSAVAIRNAQTHQRVVQMNEELQKILSTIESGVIAIGAKRKIALFNPAAEQLTGVLAQNACGRTLECLPAPLGQLIAATADDGQSRSQVEFSLPDASGQLVPLVCSTSSLRGAQGEPTGAVAVLADLSRLKELEQEKRRAERLESFEAIASGMVHEIRNPLVAIKTFTQLLPIRHGDEDYRETFSRVADREIRRIEDLLTRFRTVSSASSQPLEPVDVLGPLQETLETLQPMLEQSRVRLRRVADGTPRCIQANTSQLVQLFLNLCLNSIEAMEGGGELTVRVADLSEGGGSTLLVEISDTGSGIPEDLLGTIFNPFVTTKAHGMGLGLAICRSITDAHHARLSARNNAGRPGCTFTIEFPVSVTGAVRITT